ncbi:transglycosylase domain-containing protein [Nitratiruptor sp. YY09-18]|uniref:transglycosylase domain-containing protein n=1 Tax=Nitratiruptor sp. YY09-18 TaxID=2724901 RepID=UPI0019160F51|nr:PBP1A family penicillin-binding protein [Nitratiruptor sp. YY09-18]BCD68625.1 penicillin-binding protein 1A [Nitratiruptor sp. YY09-18]
MKKVLKFFASVILLATLATVIFGFFYLGELYSKVAPKAQKIIEYHPNLATKIYDRNGNLIATIYKENRDYVKYDEIPGRMIEALLAIEDTKFFEHRGINFDAIFRAAIKDIKAGKFVEGASTITQQLVKNMVLTRKKKLSRKFQEILIAMKVESALTKEQILERYFNQIYFGHRYYGIKSAAKGYFHKPLSKLTLKEIAMLVGLPRAPSYYDPTRNYQEALKRADRVINRMYELGWIDEKTFVQAIAEQPKVYKKTVYENRAPYIVDEIVRSYSSLLPHIKTAGYKIYTTVDLELQDIVKEELQRGYEEIMKRGVGYNYARLNGASVVVRPQSGEILAFVGGVDYQKSAFNRVTQAKRQPGSAFKPFIYQIALDMGYSQLSKIPDIAKTYTYYINGQKKIWKPKNYEKNFEGVVTLKEALVHSRNLATINLVEQLGLQNVIKRLQEYGFENLPHNLSLALGTVSLSPLKLAGFYTIFSNYGKKTEPILIRRVLDFQGNEIFAQETQSKKLEEPKQAFLMIDILRDVVNRGTGRKARVPGVEVAGKTGTTNNYMDAWFCGFTPDLEVVTWYGQDDNTPLKHSESGGKAAAPVVGRIIKRIYALWPQLRKNFTVPAGVYSLTIDGKRYYFTDISKPKPLDTTPQEKESEDLLF